MLVSFPNVLEVRCREIWPHVEILADCNLIVETKFDNSGKNNSMRLSMQGYDLVDTLRNDEIWTQLTSSSCFSKRRKSRG